MLKPSSLQRQGLALEGPTESREAAWLWGMTRVGEQTEGERKEGKGTVSVLQYPISHSSAHLRSICFPPVLLQVLQGMLDRGLGMVPALWQGLGNGA